MLGRVLLFVVACAVVLAATSPLASVAGGLPPGLVIGTVAGGGAFLLTLIFVRWDRIPLEDVGAAFRRASLPRFVLGFVLGLLLVGVHALIEALVGGMRWVRVPGAGVAGAVSSLVAYLALACREELAFHGYPLRRLKPAIGLWGAQLVVAALFAAEHVLGGASWTQALLGAAVGSLLFGMAALATGGLALPIGLHAAWNFGDWLRGGGGKGSGGLWTGVVADGLERRAGIVALVGYDVVMLSAVLVFWWWLRRKTGPASSA